jgi:SDR family mycofactocin-dependent oxidoreductase
MPGRVEGKVAFITGAARGQGRSHAVMLAEEGAAIIAVDSCEGLDHVKYPAANEEDLAETVRAVEAVGGRIVARKADVRDFGILKAAVKDGVAEFGRLDIVVANAGIASEPGLTQDLSEEAWRDVIDVNLTGVWLTCKAAIPEILKGGAGGSIVVTSSSAGIRGYQNIAHYVASKHGVIGLMRTLANELAAHMVRVNTINPSQVDTPLFMNPVTYELFCPDVDNPTTEQFAAVAQGMHALPVPWLEPMDVSNAVVFLASDESRYITGVTLPVDAGLLQK